MENLRWRDIMPAKNGEGHEIVVLLAHGSGRSGKVATPNCVGDYRERVRATANATHTEGSDLTNVTDKPAKRPYNSSIADLLDDAKLRKGTQGVPRETYCFRHTYATHRLQEGVDAYFLADPTGISVHMIEEYCCSFVRRSASLSRRLGRFPCYPPERR